MNDYLRILGLATGISVAALAAIVFVLKRVFEFGLNRELEKAKITFEKEKQHFQNELDRISSEFTIKLSSIQGKRIDVVEQLYKKLILLQASAHEYTRKIHPVISDGEAEAIQREKNVNDSFFEFNQYYFPNRIYLSKSICGKIDNVHSMFFDSLWEFGYARNRLNGDTLNGEWRKTFLDELTKQGDKIRSEIAPIIEEIESELRKIIGTE